MEPTCLNNYFHSRLSRFKRDEGFMCFFVKLIKVKDIMCLVSPTIQFQISYLLEGVLFYP